MKQQGLETFREIGTSEAFAHYYDFNINGKMPASAYQFIESAPTPANVVIPDDIADVQDVVSIASMDELDEFPITIEDDGTSVLNLGPKIAEALSGVYFYLMGVADEGVLLFGKDNDLETDWDNGIFKDNFRGVWPAIDGHFIYLEIDTEEDDYTLYQVPILLNGRPRNLYVRYDYGENEGYTIIGARKEIDEHGASDKRLRKLRPGDEITTRFWVMLADEEDGVYVDLETFTVTRRTSIEEQDLDDGKYIFFYDMVDAQDNTRLSANVYFTITDGTILVSDEDDDEETDDEEE
jgi:hypothetical protein